jgi:hypothetical protein
MDRPVKSVDGEVVPLTDAELAQWLADTAAPPQPIPIVVTALRFLEAFSAAERTAIRAAARAPGGEALDDWLDMLRAAQVVDLRDPRTAAGLAALVGAGLLTAARRDDILAGKGMA